MANPTVKEVKEWMMTLYTESQNQITSAERTEQRKYATMVKRPRDKQFLVKMLDESSQIRDSKILARRIKDLIDEFGIPEFLNTRDRFLFKLYQTIGHYFDFIAVPIIKKRLRSDSSRVILDAARPKLTKHLATRFEQKIGQNVNLLGEVVLGNKEADARYYKYLDALEQPDINYISVKISGIYAQTHSLNYEESFPELVRRMSALYQKAIDFPYVDADGVKRSKFINLDMEEYKDFHLTIRVFKETLSKPEFLNYEAGIVVQSYLPDAWNFQTELLEFAKERVARGGAPIKMRIVKGCNLDMETITASLRGWANPVLPNKTIVDANYLKLIERGLIPENAKALHIGMASHNLFTISYAYLLTQKLGTPKDCFCFEMLEGMADHVWRAQSKLGNHVILYAPVVKQEDFLYGISYLVRRMDEQTAPDNFLTHSFDLKPDTDTWRQLERQFEEAYKLKDNVTEAPARTQDRNKPYTPVPPMDEMVNEPDTDFDLVPNQKWQADIFKKWKKSAADKPEIIPLQIGAKTVETVDRQKYFDRSQGDVVQVAEMCRAGEKEIAEIIKIADEDPAGWRKTTLEQRHEIMYKAANLLAEMRGDLIGSMCAITGKTVVEGDVEVSEGVDYCRFYTTSMKKFAALSDVKITAKGTILVISPWNFPCAIPCGGVVAALAGGNTCILKPASVAAPVAWLFAKAFWDAGVPKEALQVVITDRPALKALTTAPEIKHIILTGGTDTAQAITRTAPLTPLSAETGGKNAMILTASGDQDHAIMNACHSAFGNAGQKCSACSLFLVHRSIYNDPKFMAKLKDCAESIKVGPVWNAGNVVGPMITNRNDKLEKAFTLEPGEKWLVEPKFVDEKKYILAPTIKIGAKPENFSFRTELFAPLLTVAPFDTLEEAVAMVNSLDYGLTSGLQSLDEKEQAYWKENIVAGNLYINRSITGAIVNRQPFGGMKKSAFGGGVKAGGPNYVACFVDIKDKPGSTTDWRKSYADAYESEFRHARDWNQCVGEQNVFRYRHLDSMVLRLLPGDSNEYAEMVAEGARLCGTPLTISYDPSDDRSALARLGLPMVAETMETFLQSMPKYDRVRVVVAKDQAPRELYERAAECDKYIASGAPLKCGRVELIHYIKEQSVTYEYHRYGSIQRIPPVE